MTTRYEPANIRPWGYGSPVLTAFEEVARTRLGGLLNQVADIALYDPDRVPEELLGEVIGELSGYNTPAGVGLYQPALGVPYLRQVMRDAYQLNLLRGTDAALTLYAAIVGVGFYYQIGRVDTNGQAVPWPNAGIPANITFYIAPRGLTLTQESNQAMADGFQSLLPRTLDVILPIRTAHEAPGEVAVVAYARQIVVWDSHRVPYEPGRGDTSWGPSFNYQEFR